MITIKGVKKDDQLRVARAIVTALGIFGVCTAEVKCAPAPGCCSSCVIKNYFTFIDESEG